MLSNSAICTKSAAHVARNTHAVSPGRRSQQVLYSRQTFGRTSVVRCRCVHRAETGTAAKGGADGWATLGRLPSWLHSGLASVALAALLALPAPAPGPVAAAPAGEGIGGVSGGSAVLTEQAVPGSSAAPSLGGGTGGGLKTVYFGNGCFWGRQQDFVDVELSQLGRSPERVTALVGYAGGQRTGPEGRVCYVYSDPRTRYDLLGHAEVVQLGINEDGEGSDPRVAEAELRAFAARYFQQFARTPRGMQRLDPQDEGPAYRNVIGLPGGVHSPWFHVIQEENKYGMDLLEGQGNLVEGGRPTEEDLLNTVWVVDSDALPFHRAEKYHQFHNGVGKAFPKEYIHDLKDKVADQGRIDPTGCFELFPF